LRTRLVQAAATVGALAALTSCAAAAAPKAPVRPATQSAGAVTPTPLPSTSVDVAATSTADDAPPAVSRRQALADARSAALPVLRLVDKAAALTRQGSPQGSDALSVWEEQMQSCIALKNRIDRRGLAVAAPLVTQSHLYRSVGRTLEGMLNAVPLCTTHQAQAAAVLSREAARLRLLLHMT